MREALDILGFGPCHHMRALNEDEEQKRRWREFVGGGEPDWDRLFEGYRSCVDWPSAHYWETLVQVYPDAKVLLTWRDPESWFRSFSQTIARRVTEGHAPEGAGVQILTGLFGDRISDQEFATRIYLDNIERVMAKVPRDRLVVHEIGAGWEPLCEGLGVPVPDIPYPSRNSASEFIASDGLAPRSG